MDGGTKVEEGEGGGAAGGGLVWPGHAPVDPMDTMAAAAALAEWQVVKKARVASPAFPAKAGHVRVVCISDTHSLEDDSRFISIPDGDILVHTGDFSNCGSKGEVARFAEWFAAQPHKHKVVVAGNHDTIMERSYYEARGAKRFHDGVITGTAEECRAMFDVPGVTYLEDAGTEIMGLKIWGSPWQPEFNDWAFNLPRGSQLQDKWDLIPTDTDVLLTHSPPLLHGDRVSSGFRAGCVNLLHAVQTRVKPRLHAFGHCHEGYGATSDGTTIFVNSSTCDHDYNPRHPAIVIDVPVAREAPLASLAVADEVTLFDKIVAGTIPSDRVYEDDVCLAFRDIAPVAPVHILVVPKNRDGLSQLSKATPRHKALLGHLMWAAAEVARQQGLDRNGYRVVVNDGKHGGQAVYHLHLHIIGGKQLKWPPGV